MKLEFENGKITIQANAFKWGPYIFDLTKGLPDGRTLASIDVTSYLGRVKPDDSDILSTFTDTTAELINNISLFSTLKAAIYFDRPTTAAWINQKHSLVFDLTLDAAGGGGTHTAFFYNVEVI